MLFPAILTGSQEQRLRLFVPGWLVLTLCQLWQTRRLWFVGTDYPQIPLLSLPPLPAAFDAACFSLLVTCLVISAYFTLRNRWQNAAQVLFIAASALALLFTLNLHRLQPWAYLFWLTAILFSCAPARVALPAVRALVISVYVYSAWSKLDFAFLHGNGQQFISTFFQILNVQPPTGIAVSPWAAAAIPLVEFLVGAGLIFRSTRFYAICLGVAMHACLLLVLGPLGMSHCGAVLTWNVLFVWTLFVLFWPFDSVEVEPSKALHPRRRPAVGSLLGIAVTLFAIVAPLAQPIGWYDHWPSWALYANRNSRARVYVGSDWLEQLPSHVSGYLPPTNVTAPDWGQPVHRLDIGKWSLEELRVPVYPQSRFQLAVALAFANRHGLGESIFVQLESASDRLDGNRDTRRLDGIDAIRAAAAEFVLNTRERDQRSR